MLKACVRWAVAGLALFTAGAAHAGKADDTLNIAFTAEIATLDNYKESSREGLMLMRFIFDCLLDKDPNTNEFKPALASSYKRIDDKTLEFVIRDGVKFHNGATLSADDVVYTLNLVSSKDYKIRWPISVEWMEKVEKISDNTVRITAKQPGPLALEMIAGNLPIYPRGYYAEVGPEGMGVKPIGTGPYRAVEVRPGSRFVFERFDEHYAGSPKGKASIKRIITRVLPEMNTQYAELFNGGLDFVWRIPPKEAANLERRPNIQMKSVAIVRYAFIQINPNFDSGKSPVADVRVRRALAAAIDREGIRKAFVGGASEVIHAACSPAQFGCTKDVARYDFDAAKAKALLTEAGHPNGFEIDLLAWSNMRTETEAIVANWARIGVKANVNFQQGAAAGPIWRGGKAPLYLANWGSYGVSDIALSTSHHFTGLTDDQVKDSEVIAWLKAGDAAPDREKRLEPYAKALKKIADQAYMIPLWTFNVNYALSKDLDLKLDVDEFGRFYHAKWK